MINKKQLIIFIAALIVVIAFVILGFHTSDVDRVSDTPSAVVEQGPLPAGEVDSVSVNEKNQYYTINAAYPKTNSDAITAYFKTFIDDQVTQFKSDTSWVYDIPSAAEGVLTLDVSYKSVPSTRVQNYVFTVNTYTGGAHGMQFRKTYSYNTEGQLLSIQNFFKSDANGLATLSSLVQKELLKRPNAQADWIADGAAAKEENYRAVIATDEGLTVLFDPYQVAPYSDGAINIKIPLSAFRSIANPDIFPLTQ